MSTEMRNWMGKRSKRIAFGLAVLLLALQLSPLSLTEGMGQIATAESVGTVGEETPGSGDSVDSQATDAPESSQDPANTQEPANTQDPANTQNPEESKEPAATERPVVLEPDQVDCIVATGGAVFVEDTSIKVSGLQATNRTTTSITLSWKKAPDMDITGYYLYQYDFELRDYVWVDTVEKTEYTIQDLKPGQEFYYTVSAFSEKDKLQSHFCAPLHTYTVPEKLETITMKTYAKTSITLSWKKVASATGYLIYRATETGGFTQVGTTTAVSYKDTGLTNGTTYRYMVRSYAYVADNAADYSSVLYMTTKTKAPTVKAIKGGDGRVRIKWSKLAKAEGYQIYRYDGKNYVSIANITANTTVKYINTGLTNGKTYSYKVCGYRKIGNTTYIGDLTSAYSAKTVKVAKTSTSAFLFKSKKAFKKSSAYKTCKFLKKKVKYAKSIIIPGLKNTNLNGFGCTTMIPQGMTFAKSYMLISAYDSKGVENSVLYVIKKSTKKLVTTVELPSTTHAGGLAYDGRNLWIASSTNLLSIPFSKISSAASKGLSYLEIPEYAAKVAVGQQAATITYYKSKLWVASYNELSAGYLGSYTIVNKNATPSLTLCSRIKVANRIQGMAFTSKGYLILSRSCQTNSKQRGFLHQLDVYKPNIKKASKGIIKLGRVRKHIDMPTMNEEIAISGSYLYVNYESGAFPTAVNRMDRICAFKVSAVTK
ncbi:MAG: fibronectin type III domain-containing protein [Lachnospiraceae bacterium]|nr:fibronectin type III domain-containing protein [Lachnospiraceae bacterium]